MKSEGTLFFSSCGCTITAEELYKIDKTAMADVLAAERTREETQSKPSARAISPEGKGEEEEKEGTKEGEEETEERDEELSLELEEILKTCDAIQQTTTRVGGVDSDEGEEGEGEKGEAGEECVLMEATLSW